MAAITEYFFHQKFFFQGSGPIVLDDVNCTGLELYVTDCPSSGFYIHNCAHSEDAGVRCNGTRGSCLYSGISEKWTHFIFSLSPSSHALFFTFTFISYLAARGPQTQYTYPIRLVTGGTAITQNEGTVEILHNGTWSAVCDDYWGYTEAVVACHMLGFATAVRAYTRQVDF